MLFYSIKKCSQKSVQPIAFLFVFVAVAMVV